jgi:hypothetical protein
MYQLISSKKTFLIARDAWKDHVQEREEMQLDRGGEAIILALSKKNFLTDLYHQQKLEVCYI